MYFIRKSGAQPDQQSGPEAPSRWIPINSKFWAEAWFKKNNPQQKPWWIRIFFIHWILNKLFLRDLHNFARALCEGIIPAPTNKEVGSGFYTKVFLSCNPETIKTRIRVTMALVLQRESAEAIQVLTQASLKLLDPKMARAEKAFELGRKDSSIKPRGRDKLLTLAKKFEILPETTKSSHFKGSIRRMLNKLKPC